MAVTITYEELMHARACEEQLDLFENTFGDSVTFDTLEAFVTACQSHPFDYEWAAENLLTRAASAGYTRVKAAARADYERVTAAALAAYNRVKAAARTDYDRVTAAARADYDRVRDAAFANAYWNQQKD